MISTFAKTVNQTVLIHVIPVLFLSTQCISAAEITVIRSRTPMFMDLRASYPVPLQSSARRDPRLESHSAPGT